MGRRARRSSFLCLATAVAITLTGCASTRDTVGGWLGTADEAAAPAQSAAVYYSRMEGLKVYGAPSSSAAVVGALSLHEKVTRSRVDGGYAYVASTKRDLKGWVDNAHLIWRLPSAPSAEATPEPAPAVGAQPEEPAAAAEAPPAAAAEEPQPAAAPADTQPAARTAEPNGSEPSVFDAY
jgi:hypothetical protein